MNQNYKFFAKLYDKMMADIAYELWEQYLLQLLFRYKVPPMGKILELGCGTGRMTRLLSKEGFKMTGLDLSEEMLEIAKNIENDYKTEDKEREKILYNYGDMRDFQLNEKQDAIISICDSMNYLLTVDDLSKTMKSARENLKPGGVFIFDLKTEYFYKNELDGEIFTENLGEYSYVWNNFYIDEEHIHEYSLRFYEGAYEKGKEPISKELHKQRAFFAKDIKDAAIHAGFDSAIVYDAFTYDKPRKNSERIYIILNKCCSN